MTPMKLRWRRPKLSLAQLTRSLACDGYKSILCCCLIVFCIIILRTVCPIILRRFKSHYFILIVLIVSRGVQRYTGFRYRNQW
jgi:hypothetical protein